MSSLRSGKELSKNSNNNTPSLRISTTNSANMMKMLEEKLNEHKELFMEQLKLVEDIIMEHFSGLSASISNLSSDLNKLARRVGKVEELYNSVDKVVDQLKTKISVLENDAVAADIVIRNVPNSLDPSTVVNNLLKSVSCSIQPTSVFRVSKQLDSSKSVPIIAKLESPQERIKLFRSIGEFRKKRKRQLNVADCGFNGDANIMVHECITTYNRNILGFALNFKKNGLLNSVFTLRGWVYVRVNENSKAIKITSDDMLNKVVGGANTNV